MLPSLLLELQLQQQHRKDQQQLRRLHRQCGSNCSGG
jgi:hypothetical protein